MAVTWRMTMRMRATTAVTAIVAAAACCAVAWAQAPETLLVAAGPSGSADNAAISQDKRAATIVAFDSAAPDLVDGDANGQRDVFVLRRAQPFGLDGAPWQPGALALVSHAANGAPANGPSHDPALSGDSRTAPGCVAFISDASNLVPGDTNGKPDAFVAFLGSGRIVRVSVSSSGAQANGASYAVAVDGRCRRVAFISDAGNLYQRTSPEPSRKALRTAAPPTGSRQVYVRGLGGPTGIDKAIAGVTFMLTARGRQAANGSTANIAMAPNGKNLAFDTTATNLDPRDPGATRDVYATTLTRIYLRKRKGRRPQTFRRDTTLVSRDASGPGDGASSNPAISADAKTVAFTTAAPNLVAGASADVTQIAVANMTTGAIALGSHPSGQRATPGDGPSDNATLTVGGDFVAYDTAARNIPLSAAGGAAAGDVRSVMIGTQGSGTAILVSQGPAGALPTPSARAATSAHGNYVVFSSGEPSSVLLRYVGPR
jgi:hypothetical protein